MPVLIEISLRLRRIVVTFRERTKPFEKWFLQLIFNSECQRSQDMMARGQNVAAFIKETL